jgi:hypothetical protein
VRRAPIKIHAMIIRMATSTLTPRWASTGLTRRSAQHHSAALEIYAMPLQQQNYPTAYPLEHHLCPALDICSPCKATVPHSAHSHPHLEDMDLQVQTQDINIRTTTPSYTLRHAKEADRASIALPALQLMSRTPGAAQPVFPTSKSSASIVKA